MTENKNILEVHHLKKSFTTGKKSFTAVEDISFFLKTGEVLGIVSISFPRHHNLISCGCS